MLDLLRPSGSSPFASSFKFMNATVSFLVLGGTFDAVCLICMNIFRYLPRIGNYEI